MAMRPYPVQPNVAMGAFMALHQPPKVVRPASAESHGIQTEQLHDSPATAEVVTANSGEATPEWEVLSEQSDDHGDSCGFILDPAPSSNPGGLPVMQETSESIELESPQIVEFEEAHALLVDNLETAMGRATLVKESTSAQTVSEIGALRPLKLTTKSVNTPSSRSTAGVQANVRPKSEEAFVNTTDPMQTQPPPAWDLQSTVHKFVMEAWQNLGFNRPEHRSATSLDELQVLLDKGYSNDGGILTFLLAENNNNAAAVLELLKGQHL